jgi:regulator of replication initiation timing
MTSSHLTFSQKEELKNLQLKMQQEEIVELSKENKSLSEDNYHLRSVNDELKRKLYGPSSERTSTVKKKLRKVRLRKIKR